MTRLGIIALARETFDTRLAADVAGAAVDVVGTVGEVVGSPTLVTDEDGAGTAAAALAEADIDAAVVLQATFADSSMVVAVADRLARPLLLWSFPESRTGGRLRLNSLCGTNLAAHALRRRSHPMGHLHVRADDRRAADELRDALDGLPVPMSRPVPPEAPITTSAADAEAVANRLADRRIGVIGEHPIGFEPCRYDPEAVAATTGVTIDAVALSELFAASDAVTTDALVRIRSRAESDLGSLDALDARGVDQSLRLYGGLRILADDHEWAAVATRCWPECMTEYGGAACAPQAMLTADRIPGMCEADALGALTALLLQELGGGTPFVADLVDIDPADDTGVLWHCGLASRDLAHPSTPPHGIVHTNRGVPLLHEFALAPGPVTFARLSQAGDVLSLVLGRGEILDRPRPFAGTSGVVRFECPAADVFDRVMRHGLEHHYGIVGGVHDDVLRALATRWDLPVVELTRG